MATFWHGNAFRIAGPFCIAGPLCLLLTWLKSLVICNTMTLTWYYCSQIESTPPSIWSFPLLVKMDNFKTRTQSEFWRENVSVIFRQMTLVILPKIHKALWWQHIFPLIQRPTLNAKMISCLWSTLTTPSRFGNMHCFIINGLQDHEKRASHHESFLVLWCLSWYYVTSTISIPYDNFFSYHNTL